MQNYRNWAPVGVGVAVAAAMTIAFSSPLVGVALGTAAAVVLLWEQRAGRRRDDEE